jgi:hypothetical protein
MVEEYRCLEKAEEEGGAVLTTRWLGEELALD